MLNLDEIKSYCLYGWEIETRPRRNNTDVTRYKGTFKAQHTPEIPFMIDIDGNKTRLLFPTSEARKAADEYGAREDIKNIIKEA